MAALSCFIHSLTKRPTMRSSMCTQFLWRQKLPAMWQWCVWTTVNWSKKAMFWSRSIRACNRFNIYCSYQQFFAGYYGHFADLCVEHHLLRLRNRLVVETIGIVFFDVCFYRFCLGIVPQTTHLPVHFVLRQGTQ